MWIRIHIEDPGEKHRRNLGKISAERDQCPIVPLKIKIKTPDPRIFFYINSKTRKPRFSNKTLFFRHVLKLQHEIKL